MLDKIGFRKVEVNIEEIARSVVGKARYLFHADISMAPGIVRCSTFTSWAFGILGIELGARSVQQWEGGNMVNVSEAKAGDLIFSAGHKNYFIKGPQRNGIGHVGLVTSQNTVIHASWAERTVIETEFKITHRFRGIRRYLPDDDELLTFEVPPHINVKRGDDIFWTLAENLPMQHKK